jgi:hypothetical protein
MGIDEQQARMIASCWHDGQSSALYAFNCTGARRVDALLEVERELRLLNERIERGESAGPWRDLQMLVDYLKPDEWRQEARELGEDAGRAAGSWAADGNTPSASAVLILAALNDGDPAGFDALPPEPHLEDPDIARLAFEIVGEEIDGMPNKRELTGELADAWQEGVTNTFTDACIRVLDGAVQWTETEYGDALFAKDGIEVRASSEQTRRWASAQEWPYPMLAGREVEESVTSSLTQADGCRQLPVEELTAWSEEVLNLAAHKIGLKLDTAHVSTRT